MITRLIYSQFACSRRCFSSKSTIFGLSSGAGKCGVAVIRVSGDASADVLRSKTKTKDLPIPRKVCLKGILHSKTAEMIDRGLVIWFPGPSSFTGEDSVEFHVHGGVAVVSAMYDSLGSVDGVRLAEPGEFTKRAFYAGKMDLTAVEGLADLIDAETEAQRKQALLQASGELSKLYNRIRSRLVKCIAHMEAYIDFAEDQDVGDDVLTEVKKDVGVLVADIQAHLHDHRRGERLRSGVRAVVIGAPNVGKSSFVNLLSNRKVSIVTDVAGTTRDIVESHHDIGGYPFILADTAGLRACTKDIVEKEGITKAKDYIELADLIILMVDSTHFQKNRFSNNIDQYIDDYLNTLGYDRSIFTKTRSIVIFNKTDLLPEETLKIVQTLPNIQCLSCHNHNGFEKVLKEVTKNLKFLCGNPNKENPHLSQQRHRYHLKQCVQNMEKFTQYLNEDCNPDMAIATQQLRSAIRNIGKITGSVETEEILDVIFSSFCIGK
ncbi:tRNA modification GTPase GTPBP3, mitochondrial [Malaya genurostris]|uniref:tRNA modification GTPase GTPBP3, mitochondrial n=1 Tax=Malaya genurostris TaxID=325434 RepID=UPI0026F3BE60|nr:tRNA modification GTPase GTPBP3, mitochondrial [Malaya genurostris]